ncbi:nicotinate-nucleotide--dimethylbenzimidazole phosphoribosyltransferase [Roseateles sp. YR242]|uniref:nicotinate-nucleotide--dimethylbenzimidazole phosphoribosyltransferase n=1 Tax=Roseateles sp. YR242 TaxID=1855305 RepID=UPI0008C3BAD2|nr:nicotinate-nucleotide--dimethylbenzimidazole phosphoribosyltransferase [Roseateles sp. YR242]SEL74559.1 nicotinate-nucleotide--dimethylbenzimidazole phosphoribosyltransferase [Roseateles sp. YR242]
MSIHQSLISPTLNPELERALRARLEQRSAIAGRLGELEPLAVRLGLIQNTLTPELDVPTLMLFAGDHGLAVDGVKLPNGRTTREQALLALQHRLPSTVFANNQGMHVTVVDCGIAEPLSPQPGLLARKIAHGTRNSRVGPAMTVEQAHAGVRVGMEISDHLSSNVLACAGLGQGATEAAALVLSRLMDMPVRDFLISGPDMPQEDLTHLLVVLHGAQARHREVEEPMAVLAAFGGFELAVMVGAMLVAASKRQLILVDGMSACAALKVASLIAPPVTDYAVFCRSTTHRGLDEALALFHAAALLELGMDCSDGTGAPLAWPMVRCAAALLTEVQDIPDGPIHSRPTDLQTQAAGTTPSASAALNSPSSGLPSKR